MKKLTILLLVIIMTIPAFAAWDGTVASGYAGGDGTKDNPYLISSCEQFAYFAKCVNDESNTTYSRGKYFKLTADLTFNENVLQTLTTAGTLDTDPGSKSFRQSPCIGSFTSETVYQGFQGVLDGAGHTIKGLYYSDWGVHAYTMFSCIDGGTVKNLLLSDVYVLCGSFNSALAAAVINGTIINCGVDNFYGHSWKSSCGGLIGRTLGKTTIKNCFAYGAMNVKNNSGGLVGKTGGFNDDVDFTTIQNCYTKMDMTYASGNEGSYGMFGGIVGDFRNGSSLINCWYCRKTTSSASGVTVLAYPYCYKDKSVTNATVTEVYEVLAAKYDSIVAKLNANSENIPGACRWTTMSRTLASGKSYNYPTFDFTQAMTPEEEIDDVNTRITDVSPANADTHVLADGGKVTLSWTASADGKTNTQNIYIGTSKEEVSNATTPTATIGKETSYTVSDLDICTTYYWRVDRVTAEGKASKGDVYYFRPAHLAFPGAEGYGRLAHGGRGGNVVYVTNLNNSGEGSLRWALTNGSGPRTVMFKVSGIIDMEYKTCRVDDYVTIAAQTAPGKGIMIFHSDIAIGKDNICRFLRARRGLGDDFNAQGLLESTGNALGMGADNAIVDHTSLSWGTDETFSTRTAKDITFQRSMIAEALGMAYHRKYTTTTNHGYAATIGGDIGSFTHNLLANCYGRNWSMGGGTDAAGAYAGRLDIINNVCYNWGTRTTDGGAMEVNFIGNYYKMGYGTKLTNLFTLDIEGDLKGTQQAYVAGNVRDNLDGSLTQDKLNDTYCTKIASSRTTPVTWERLVSTPFFGGEHHGTLEKAEDAYKSVLSDNGANQPCLDEQDKRIIKETLNRTYTYTGSRSGIKGQLDDEEDITAEGTTKGVEIYEETSWADDYDSDQNGLPQWWEKITGQTNPNAYTAEGYTALEDYLNFLATPHVVAAPEAEVTLDLTELFAGYTKSPAFSIEGTTTAASVNVKGNTLTVKAGSANAIGSVVLKVVDAEGSSYQRALNIAVTGDAASGISAPLTLDDVVSCEIYTLGGVKVSESVSSLPRGIYVMKAIDRNGNKRSAKIIAN